MRHSLRLLRRISRSPLARTSSLYVIANLANAAPPFLLLPILTRSLSKEDYGILAMIQVLVAVLGPFLGLNLNGAVSKKFFDLSAEEHGEYVGTGLCLLFPPAIAAALLAGAAYLVTRNVLGIPSGWLLAVVGLAFAQAISNTVLVNWQVRSQPIPYGLFRVAQTLLDLATSIVFVVALQMSWEGRIIAQTTVAGVFAVIGIGLLLRKGWMRLRFRKGFARHALEFGVPLVPHALGAVAIAMADRIFIAKLVGIEAAGVYTVGYQVAYILAMLITSFNEAWIPWLFSKLKDRSSAARIEVVKTTYFVFGALLVAALALGGSAPLLFKLVVGKKFWGGARFVIWLAFGHAFNGMYKMIVGYIFFAEKTGRLAAITFLSACLNIGLAYVLIRANGTIGAAQASMIANFVAFCATWIVASRLFKMPWRLSLLQESR